MAKRLDAAAVAKKWQANTTNNIESMKAGVNSVTTNPAQEAAAAVDLWQQRVSSQEARDKFTANLGKVTLQDWRAAMLGKGVANMQNGVRDAGPKMERFLREFLPIAAASSEQVKSMPKGTEAAAMERVRVNMQNMKTYRRS